MSPYLSLLSTPFLLPSSSPHTFGPSTQSHHSYLARRSVPREHLQLLGTTALLLAGKHEEVSSVHFTPLSFPTLIALRFFISFQPIITHHQPFMPALSEFEYVCASSFNVDVRLSLSPPPPRPPPFLPPPIPPPSSLPYPYSHARFPSLSPIS